MGKAGRLTRRELRKLGRKVPYQIPLRSRIGASTTRKRPPVSLSKIKLGD